LERRSLREIRAADLWNEFFEVFGKKRRTLAAFEEPVPRVDTYR